MISFRTLAVLALAAAASTPALAQTSSSAAPVRRDGDETACPDPALGWSPPSPRRAGKSGVAPGPDPWGHLRSEDGPGRLGLRKGGRRLSRVPGPAAARAGREDLRPPVHGPKSRFSITLNSSAKAGSRQGPEQRAASAAFNFATDDEKSLGIADAMKRPGSRPTEGSSDGCRGQQPRPHQRLPSRPDTRRDSLFRRFGRPFSGCWRSRWR